MKDVLIVVATLAVLAPPAAFADGGGESCTKTASQEQLTLFKKAEDAEKAGRSKEAYDAAKKADVYCIADNFDYKPEVLEERLWAIRRKTSLKLGELAESKGRLAEAHQYYSENYHALAADRVKMKLATAKPDDFKTVSIAVFHFRETRERLNRLDMNKLRKINLDDGDAIARRGWTRVGLESTLTERDSRLKAISGYLSKLQAIATKEGEKYLAEEDRIFSARKKSVAAKRDTLAELNKARDWFGLFGQEKRANDRAVHRGDTLLADDSRKSLVLAISYYEFPIDNLREKRVEKVRDKARRLGDAHLAKGEKKIAADYYNLAGLGDKAEKLGEADEAEREKAETRRRDKFKKGQKSLEKELGL